MEEEILNSGGYPVEPYTEVIPGLTQASAAHPPAEMLSMFDVLIDVGGRDTVMVTWDRTLSSAASAAGLGIAPPA